MSLDPISLSGWVLAGILAADRIRIYLSGKSELTEEDLEAMLREIQAIKRMIEEAEKKSPLEELDVFRSL